MKNFVLKLFKPQQNTIKWVILPILIVLIILGSLGYLDRIIGYLSAPALTFTFGKTSFSVYELLKICLVLIVLVWSATFIANIATANIKQLSKLSLNSKALLRQCSIIGIYTLAFFIGLNVLDVNLTSFAILGGAIGIGVGFGLQKIASNFISGIILLFEKAIKYDDLIELSDGTTGFIREMGARYILLATFNGKEILIPNEDLITNRVTHLTYSNKQARIDITIRVSYKSDIKLAQQLLLEAANENPLIIKEPEAVCYLRKFADNTVNFVLFCWVEDVNQGRYSIQSEIMLSILEKFNTHDIVIPYPQRDVHLKHNPKNHNLK